MNKENQNPKIEILPEHIIDQIKAGEVLERPASLIKELLENSLDAGSTEINLHVVENGLDLLSIEDNGHGMDYENLPFAFLRHATSKLKTYEDLYKLNSFGFRGEALASLAASARLTCTTQPLDQERAGGKIVIQGGAQELLIPYRSSTHGTSIYVKDLFYNTPARLKFIKSKISEKSALKKMIYAFVLSNHKTSFSIKWDDKEREFFKIVSDCDLFKRVEQVFFSKSNQGSETKILCASESYDGYTVEVYFSATTSSTPQYRHHYLFANNRFFQDKSLHMSILRTLEPVWRLGESGHYMVKINVPPSEVDVNVHPNKTQLKFLKSDIIYSLLVTSLRKALKDNFSLNTEKKLDLNPAAQEHLFSREENQSLDLMNMNTHGDYAPSSSLPLNATITERSNVIVGFVSASIVLLCLENRFYIADVRKIMARYISFSLAEFVKKDEVSGPLLISEPFKVSRGKIDSHFDELKELGFDLDRLNVEVIALRTLPRFVPQNISRDLTTCLIQYFEQGKILKFAPDSFRTFLETSWPLSSPVMEHTLSKALEDIDLMKDVLVLLDEKNLKGIL